MKLKVTSALLKKLFKFMSWNRLLLGGYNEDHIRAKWQRVLFRLYSIFVVSTICILNSVYYFIFSDLGLSVLFRLGIVSEAAILGIISQFANSCPEDYFLNVLSRCRTSKAKRLVFHVLIYAYFRLYVYPLLFFASTLAYCCIEGSGSRACDFLFSWSTVINYIGLGVFIELQRVPAILSVGFLYCDLKTLQRTIKRKGVNQEDIVQLYESIYENFRKVEQAAKLQVLCITLHLMPHLVEVLSHFITIFKGKSVDLGDVHKDVIFVLLIFNKVIGVCLIEVIYEVQDQIKVYLLDLGIFSTSEAVRTECARVRSYLRSRRLHLVVGQAVTLGAPLLLTLASLTATYTIAATQLSNIWG